MGKDKYKNDYLNDDYDGSSYEKFRNRGGKKEKHNKGHESRSVKTDWSFLDSVDDYNSDVAASTISVQFLDTPVKETKSTAKPVYNQKPQTSSVENKPKTPQLIFGPNTHEIRTIKVDYDRLDNMEKVDGEYDNHPTFGIKFLFSGNKGLFRIAWFGRNVYERDRVFNTELEFWNSLKASK